MKLHWDWPRVPTLNRLGGELFVEKFGTHAFIRDTSPPDYKYNWVVLRIEWNDETPQEREEALQTLLLAAELKVAEWKEGVVQ